MGATIDFELKRFLEGAARVFWAGVQPPLARMEASERIYDPAADHRLPAEFHQAFDLVYLVERDLGRLKTWPLVLDEALRLLAPGGRLVVRMTNTPLCSVFELKHQVFAWGGTRPWFEHTCEDGATLFGVHHDRAARRPAGLDGFSFGVITDGRRPEQLAAFLASVRALRRPAGEAVEALVCGPESIRADLASSFPEAVFVPADAGFEDRGWITRKKNQLVARASHENVVVAHDRYTLEPDFLERLREFGGDWAFLVCRQVRPDGRRFPDWVTLGSEWAWGAPGVLDYGDWSRHLYVNGGIMIAKAECLKAIPWNELLFWNQAEDVELTRRLRALGHVPRLARRVVAVSRVWRPGTLESFEPLPAAPDRHLVPGPQQPDAVCTSPSLAYGRGIEFGAVHARALARHGVYADEVWEREADGLALPAGAFGEVACRLQVPPAGDVALTLVVRHPHPALEVQVNDHVLPCTETAPGVLRVVVPRARFAVNRVLRAHLRARAAGLQLRGLRIEPADWRPGSPLPPSAEAATQAAARAPVHPRLDGAALCVTDLPLLARGARRVAVLLPGDLGSLVATAGFLAALRAHVRPDCEIRVLADRSVFPLLEGFAGLALDWARLARDGAHRKAVLEELNAFAPELLVNAFAVRTRASDLLVHEVVAAGALGCEAADGAPDAATYDALRARYARLVPAEAGRHGEALAQALGLPPAAARLWPDAESRAAAAAALAPLAGAGAGLVALLGDDPEALAAPALARELAAHAEAGRIVVGLGGRGTDADLARALARHRGRSLNLGGTLGIAALFAVLSECDASAGGSPLFRALAGLAGCAFGSGRLAGRRMQLQP